MHHKFLFRLLAKFGISENNILVIKKLNNNLKIELKVGKSKCLVDYSTGVKQGGNLAPILFIIIMQFLTELLEKSGMRMISQRSIFIITQTSSIKVVN